MHYQFQQSSPIYCGRCLRYVHRQSVGHCSSWLVVFMLVVVQRQGLGQTVEKTVAPQLHSSDKVVDVPFVPVVQILRCRRGGDSRLPQLPLLRNPLRLRTLSWTRLLTCLWRATTGAFSGFAVQFIDSYERPCDHA